MPSNVRFHIREHDPGDQDALRRCIEELQDFERTLESDRFPGAQIAAGSLRELFAQCSEKQGSIWVAEDESAGVIGFVCAWAKEAFGEGLAEPVEAGFISDLYVNPAFRGRGVAKALLATAESFLRARDVALVTVCALARNAPARGCYEASGYRAYEVVYVKRVS